MKRSITATLAMAVFILICFGCSTIPQPPATPPLGSTVIERPQLVAGDTWTWVGDGKDDRIRTEAFERYGQDVMVLRTTTNAYVRSRTRTLDGNMMHDITSDGEMVNTRKPHSGFLEFPLWVGKSWKHTYSNSGTSRDSRYKVVSYGPVITPAGTFDAFKIEGLDQRWDRPYGIIVTIWYAPTVKNIVKFAGEEGGNHNAVSGWNFELKEYALKE